MFAFSKMKGSNIYKQPILKLFFIALTIKLLMPIIALVLVNTLNEQSFWQIKPFPNFEFTDLFKIYFHSDSGWYKDIAQHGYKDIPESIRNGWTLRGQHFAFFPLLPIGILWLTKATGLSFYMAAFVINIVSLFLLVNYFYRFLIVLNIQTNSAFRLVVLFLVFPFCLHIYFIYTESLFFTFLVACFYYIHKKNYWAFGIAAILLTLTRPNGIFMALPLYLYLLEQNGKINLTNILNSLKQAKTYCLLAMPVAFIAWMYYQYLTCGNWFAFSEAQKGWGKQSGMPYKALFKEGYWQYQFMSVYAIVFIFIAVWAYKKWRTSFNVLVWLNVLMPLIAGSAISIARYISVLFPYTLLLEKTVEKRKTYFVIMGVFILCSIVCFYFWLKGDALMY